MTAEGTRPGIRDLHPLSGDAARRARVPSPTKGDRAGAEYSKIHQRVQDFFGYARTLGSRSGRQGGSARLSVVEPSDDGRSRWGPHNGMAPARELSYACATPGGVRSTPGAAQGVNVDPASPPTGGPVCPTQPEATLGGHEPVPKRHVPTRHPHGIALPGPLPFRKPPAADTDEQPDPVAALAEQKTVPAGLVLSAAMRFCRVGVPKGWITGTDDTHPARADKLLRHLVADDTTRETRDQVWRHIIAQVRDDADNREDWNLYALGTAAFGLMARAARLALPDVDDPAERVAIAQYALIYAFLDRMQAIVTTAAGNTRWRLDIDRPNVYSRLLGGAYDHASGRTEHRRKQLTRRHDETAAEHQARIARLKEEEPREVPVGGDEEISTHHRKRQAGPDPRGMDAVIARLQELVKQSAEMPEAYRIDSTSVALLQRTYLDGEPLGHVAAELNLSQSNASKRRATAVRQLRRVIAADARVPRQRPHS